MKTTAHLLGGPCDGAEIPTLGHKEALIRMMISEKEVADYVKCFCDEKGFRYVWNYMLPVAGKLKVVER